MMAAVLHQQTVSSPHQDNCAAKPPIPPRAPPQVPQRQSSNENMNANVQLRQKSLNGKNKFFFSSYSNFFL